MFESNVIYIGTKTVKRRIKIKVRFESNVIYIGTKTCRRNKRTALGFESNVIYIGTKTELIKVSNDVGLRVM